MKFRLLCILFLITYFSVFSQSTSDPLRKEALINIEQGKYGEAIELLNRFISAYPQDAEGFNLRGFCFEKRGMFEQAFYDYRSALKLDAGNEKFKSNISRITEKFNRLLYNNISGYKREIAINPALANNYLEVGKCYKKLGEWQEAENWYDEYLEREEASADEILRYTEILSKNNHISKGEPILKEYTEKYPDDHRLWSRYGYFTMWLGKKKIALEAFKEALKLRPFFKEAMNGYDLVRGKGYVYTINDTTMRHNYGLPVPRKYSSYPIDRYYRILKKNPDDISTRYCLIDELVKKNRYEEAIQQIRILSVSQVDENRFKILESDVMQKRKNYYLTKINSLRQKLARNPDDRNIVLKLAEYYSLLEDYYNAVKAYDDYLSVHPNDDEVRYKKALVISRAGDLEVALDEMKIVIKQSPSNLNYLLLHGQLLVWLNKELDLAEKNLYEVLSCDPKNIDALIALTNLNFQRNNLVSARNYLNDGFRIDPLNQSLVQLSESIDTQEKKNRKADLYKLLEKARELAFKKKCKEAITLYKKYFENPDVDPLMKKELAEAYLCTDNYEEAIKIYNNLVLSYSENYELKKQLAKIYFWQGDSIEALNRFIALNQFNPDDAEVMLFLGDSYMKFDDYRSARKVYEDLLKVSPTSHILQTRMSWLGNEGLDGYSSLTFPVYFSIIPDGNYFSDNIDFTYFIRGGRAEVGITNYLSLSVSGYFGYVSSDVTRLDLNIIRADSYFKFSKIVSGRVGAGITNFENDKRNNLFTASISAEMPGKYKFSASFNSADAVQLLYSPFIVDKRLNANHTLLEGEYITSGGILLSAGYSHLSISDNNNGDKVVLRLGKIFERVFKVGYEYYYYNFQKQVQLYWSPKNFEVHSGWIDWDIVDEDDLVLNLKGKVGVVPNDNFVVREFRGDFSYKFTKQFMLQTRAAFGSSFQFGKGYNSISLGLTAYWAL